MDDTDAEMYIPCVDPPELMKNPINLHTAPEYRGRSRESGFHKSSRQCVKIIRDAMLHHNWQEAAEFLISYIQNMEDASFKRAALAREVIWRLGTEILHHLPNAKSDDFSAVYEQMKNSGVKNYSKICLEQVFHLLLNGQRDEAKRQLSVAVSWRYGKESDAQGLEMDLIQAYCAFLDYISWHDMSRTSGTRDFSVCHDMHNHYRKASAALRKIIKKPGIWDPFVLSYIVMSEFYGFEGGTLKLLLNYAYNTKFPLNPNAHAYLYQFLKKHNAPRDQLITALRNLHCKVPSHELMVEFCSLLLQSESLMDLQEAFTVCMDLLEFSSWKCDRKAWKCLRGIMQKLAERGCRAVVRTEWGRRKSLWLVMHFRPHVGRTESLNNPKLLRIKTEVLRLTGENSREYFRIALKAKRQTSKQQLKKTKSKVQK